MIQVKETEKLIIYQEVKGEDEYFYRLHKEDQTKENVLIYVKRDNDYTFGFEGADIKAVEFIGVEKIPSFFSEYGYGFDESAINNFFKYKISETDYRKVIIAEDDIPETDDTALYFRVDDLDELKSSLKVEQRACNDTKSMLVNNFLVEHHPAINLSYKETNNNKDLILRNLNSKLLDKLTADDVEAFGQFYVNAASKYNRPDIVRRMVKGLQKNAQLLSLQEIIVKYEKLLKENPAESGWQSFFEEYITLFDNRYARKLDYRNIATGITKYPDLVLVDIYGYVDFYELKKSSTPILQYDASHKTYFWSKEFSMVIAQAADYLQKAKENSLSYAKTIREQTATAATSGIDVNIINPRAIIVAGSTKELNTAIKQNHFKTLRESLKDIEFVLYDELLDRLKNLLEVVKLA